jgi:hypothetical protein
MTLAQAHREGASRGCSLSGNYSPRRVEYE